MTPVELTQWETTSFSGAVPAVAVEGQTLFANYLGHVFAVDLASGKMLWRSASFHNLEQAAMQDQAQMIDTEPVRDRRRAAATSGASAATSRTRTTRPRSASSAGGPRAGEVVWQSPTCPTTPGWTSSGRRSWPTATLFVAGKTPANSTNSGQDSQPRQFVLAIRPHDGKLLWKTEVGHLPRGRAVLLTTGRGRPRPSRG